MANQDAWQLGADIARGSVGQKKKQGDDTDSAPSDAWSTGAAIGSNLRDRSKAKSTLKKAQQPTTGLGTTQQAISDLIPSYKKGGRVKKTGLAYVHRGEHVIPARKKTRIVASQAREPLSPAKHGKNRRVTKIVGSPVGKR